MTYRKLFHDYTDDRKIANYFYEAAFNRDEPAITDGLMSLVSLRFNNRFNTIKDILGGFPRFSICCALIVGSNKTDKTAVGELVNLLRGEGESLLTFANILRLKIRTNNINANEVRKLLAKIGIMPESFDAEYSSSQRQLSLEETVEQHYSCLIKAIFEGDRSMFIKVIKYHNSEGSEIYGRLLDNAAITMACKCNRPEMIEDIMYSTPVLIMPDFSNCSQEAFTCYLGSLSSAMYAEFMAKRFRF